MFSIRLLQKVAGVGSLALGFTERTMFGLDWVWWALIGFTVFVVSLGSWLWQLESKESKLNRKRTELEIQQRQMEIRKMKLQSEVDLEKTE